MMGRVWISLAIICFLFLTSCDGESVFSGSEAISTGGWEAGESVKFEWQVKDTLTQHDFFIDLRHDQSYPFSNIYLFVDFTFPNGKNLRDTISCNLADERGVWLGTGFGNLVDHRIGFHECLYHHLILRICTESVSHQECLQELDFSFFLP